MTHLVVDPHSYLKPHHSVGHCRPNSVATSATGHASRPTVTVAQRPARAAKVDRAGAV